MDTGTTDTITTDTLTILGCGTLGEAILRGLRAAPEGAAPRVVSAVARRSEVARRLSEAWGIEAHGDAVRAISGATVALLAVKPLGAPELLGSPGVASALAG